MEYRERIREYIVNNFLYGDGSSLTNDTSFLDSGIIDSTGILELTTFVESTFRIKLLEEELVPGNMDSVNRLARFVASKLCVPATSQGAEVLKRTSGPSTV